MAGADPQDVDVAVCTVKAVTLSGLEALLAASVTVMVQLLCVPSASVLNVMVLLPFIAEVVADEQSPP